MCMQALLAFSSCYHEQTPLTCMAPGSVDNCQCISASTLILCPGTLMADCFIIQITPDLPKSGVNTSPPVSKYEGFMLWNSVNPISESAWSLIYPTSRFLHCYLFTADVFPQASYQNFADDSSMTPWDFNSWQTNLGEMTAMRPEVKA